MERGGWREGVGERGMERGGWREGDGERGRSSRDTAAFFGSTEFVQQNSHYMYVHMAVLFPTSVPTLQFLVMRLLK